MQVVALRRYPVKSLLGEDLSALDVDERGVVGDRLWSVRTAEDKMGSGKSTRRFAAVPGILELRAATRDGTVVVTFPHGEECAVDDPRSAGLLSQSLGQPLTFARETAVTHFDDGPVSLIGTASIAALERARGAPVAAARFRPNLVVETDEAFVEDTWVGRRVLVGAVELEIGLQSRRCVMVDMKTADLPPQHGNLLAVGQLNDTCIGVIARVITTGTISVDDAVGLR